MSEPATVITDYILGAVAAWAALQLFKSPHRSRRFWALAFAALAIGAFLGGTWHGFLKSNLLWKATVMSIGVTSFGMVVGSAFATFGGSRFNDRIRDTCIAAATLKLLIYLGWMLFRNNFVFVVADTVLALVAVGIMHLIRFNGLILGGVVMSVAAGAVQASGFALHQHFNHNDLYHVIQTVAVLLLYRGARRLADSPALG